MKNILNFVFENQHEYADAKLLNEINEAFASTKLTELLKIISSKRFATAVDKVKKLNIDVRMSELTDDNVEVFNKKIDPIQHTGKQLRKVARNDGYVRLFFDQYGNSIAVTIGEFTASGKSAVGFRFSNDAYKTVHGAFDDCTYMIVLKDYTNASGAIELRNNRNFAKKDALALKNMEQLLSSKKRAYQLTIKEIRKNKMLANNGTTKWLESDILDVLAQFEVALKESMALQDFDAAREITRSINQILRLTDNLKDKLDRIERNKQTLELPKVQENPYSVKMYQEDISDYQIECSEMLNQIQRHLDTMTWYNEIEK